MDEQLSVGRTNRQLLFRARLAATLLVCVVGLTANASVRAQNQAGQTNANQASPTSPRPSMQPSSAQVMPAPLSQPRGTYQMQAPYSSAIFNNSNDPTRPGISTKFAAPMDPMHRVVGQQGMSDGISTGGARPNGIGAPASRSYTKITPAGNGANAPIGLYGGSSFGSSAGGSVR